MTKKLYLVERVLMIVMLAVGIEALTRKDIDAFLGWTTSAIWCRGSVKQIKLIDTQDEIILEQRGHIEHLSAIIKLAIDEKHKQEAAK